MVIKFKTISYSVLAFIALFCYLYPVAFNFLPIDTGEILHLCGILYFIFCIGRYLNRKMYEMLKVATLVMIVGCCATGVYNQVYDFSLIKKIFSFFLYPFSAMLVVNLISKSSKFFSIYVLLEWIIYTTILQGIISMVMYIDKDLQKYVISFMSSNVEQGNFMEVQAAFRLIALCKFQYANMAVMYGLALFSAISLAFSGKSVLYQYKILYVLSIVFISILGILSARTFFIMILFAFFYFLFLTYKQKKRSCVYMVLIICAVVLLFITCISSIENSEYGGTYRWAFEWYTNMNESQSFETHSSNRLYEMYLFPDNIKTWLWGDGRFITTNGMFYKQTDVGYLRNLFYWGLIGTLIFYYFQYKCCKILCASTRDRIIKNFSYLIFIWLLVYNFKEFWHANLYWALLLAALIKSNSLMLHLQKKLK